MSVGILFDKTTAIRKRPPTEEIDRTTGTFKDDATTDITVKVHVSRIKTDEALPGGIRIEAGDVFIHLDAALDVKPDDILVFWDRRYRVVAEIDRYEILQAAVNYARKKLLARELNRTT